MRIKKTLPFYLLWILFILGSSTACTTSTNKTLTSFEAWKSDPFPLVSAHRGGPYTAYPENALETFKYVASQIPTIIECDVAMTKDSVLVLMHDRTIDRTTTGSGNISELNYDDIKTLKLIDNNGDTTGYKIPLLSEVLEWGQNQVLFTLDIKRSVPFEKVVNMVQKFDAEPYAAIITYRLSDAEMVHALDSSLYLSVSIRDQEAIEVYKKSTINKDQLLAFVGTSEPESKHYQTLKDMGIPNILGTLGNLDRSAVSRGNDAVYKDYVKRGAMIIATDRPLEVAKVIYEN